ncbi:hypothetical protein D4Z78_31025 [Okeania hirsuta]|nr:hypothetical protein D4Z78_31025 [Okeania hirsuta]
MGVGDLRYDICPDQSTIKLRSAYATKKLSPYTLLSSLLTPDSVLPLLGGAGARGGLTPK